MAQEKTREAVSMKIRKDVKEMLDTLAKSQGRNRTNYLEWLIIQTAKKEGYDIEY